MDKMATLLPLYPQQRTKPVVPWRMAMCAIKRLMHRSKKRLLQHLIGTRDQLSQVRKHCFVSGPAKRGPSLSTDGPPPAQARQAGPQLPSQILRQKYSHLSPRIFGCLCMVLDQMAEHHSAGLENLDVKGMVGARIGDEFNWRSRCSPVSHSPHAVVDGCPVV